MTINSVKLLFVEDNIKDAGLTTSGLEKHHFTGKIFHAREGEEVADFIFSMGK